MKMKRRKIKMAVIIFLAIIGTLILAYISLIVIYPAILRSIHKIGDGGIDLMGTVEIGGIEQALYFRGEDIDNPVLLYIHGGPGSSMKPFLHDFQYAWEKDYTVVHWDQRNAGKTFYLNDPDVVLETMSFERVLEDAHEITQYIKEKLNKEQIIILGHSWGSILGTALVQKYPQDYIAYISVGQCVNMRDNDRVIYETLLAAAYTKGNKNDIAAVEALTPYPLSEAYNNDFIKRNTSLEKYLVKYNLSGEGFRRILSVMTSPYCGAQEKNYFNNVDINYYQEPIMRYLYDEYEIRNFGTAYEIPVFYIMGENDCETPYSLAKDFFEEITAPNKEFFTTPNAGHFPMQENAVEFNRVLLDVIRPLLANDNKDR